MSKLKFGKKVKCTKSLKRVKQYRPSKHYWKEVDAKFSGIFLGYRTLRNGSVYRDYEEGTYFEPTDTFRAALVCPGEYKNPVYVPLESIE